MPSQAKWMKMPRNWRENEAEGQKNRNKNSAFRERIKVVREWTNEWKTQIKKNTSYVCVCVCISYVLIRFSIITNNLCEIRIKLTHFKRFTEVEFTQCACVRVKLPPQMNELKRIDSGSQAKSSQIKSDQTKSKPNHAM